MIDLDEDDSTELVRLAIYMYLHNRDMANCGIFYSKSPDLGLLN